MICKERLIEALTQTHKALIAYTRCAEMLENEEDQKRLEQVSLL
ncbi:hypothetical protein J2S04_002903, partial [Alicyclobacillus tengchongensis]|nr:hypothetical protein [Alicyclobacillus tengchongensis]